MQNILTSLRRTASLMRLFQASGTIAIGLLALRHFPAGVAFGQADQGAITGLVQDPTGAVIANAQVTLTSIDNGLELKTQTDSSGNYVFSPVKIGNYKVAVTAPGFSKTTQENIQLHVQDRVEANIQALKSARTILKLP